MDWRGYYEWCNSGVEAPVKMLVPKGHLIIGRLAELVIGDNFRNPLLHFYRHFNTDIRGIIECYSHVEGLGS